MQGGEGMRWGRGKQFLTNQVEAWVSVVCVHCVHTPDMWSHPLQDPSRAGRAEPSLDCRCEKRALVGGICHHIPLCCPWLPLPVAALGVPASPLSLAQNHLRNDSQAEVLMEVASRVIWTIAAS